MVYERPYPRVLTDVDFNATTDRFDAYGRIVRCRSCGHVYTNPRPEPGLIEHGYAESADSEYSQESSSRALNAHLCLATIRGVVSSGKLLEVGCAAGYFLNAARTDFEVSGVEPSRWAAAEASRRFGVKVHAGTLAEAAFPDTHFDGVAMVDVTSTRPTLPRPRPRPQGPQARGLLYLVTPDIGSFSACAGPGGFAPGAPAYFSRKTLLAFLEKNGFETQSCRSYGGCSPWTTGRQAQELPRARAGVWRRASVSQGRDVRYINTRDSLEVVARKAQ